MTQIRTPLPRNVPLLHEEVRAVDTWLSLWHESDLRAATVHFPRHKGHGGAKIRLGEVHTMLPQFLCFAPRGLYNGLAVSVKRRDSGRHELAEPEVRWLRQLVRCGWYAAVCRGAPAAIDVFERYAAIPAGVRPETEGQLALPEGWVPFKAIHR